MKTDSGLSAYCHGNADFAKSDAGQPARSLYTRDKVSLINRGYV